MTRKAILAASCMVLLAAIVYVARNNRIAPSPGNAEGMETAPIVADGSAISSEVEANSSGEGSAREVQIGTAGVDSDRDTSQVSTATSPSAASLTMIRDVLDAADRYQGVGGTVSDAERLRAVAKMQEAVPALAAILGTTTDPRAASGACKALQRIGGLLGTEMPSILVAAEDSLLKYLRSDVGYPRKGSAALALSYIQPMSRRSIDAIRKEMEDNKSLRINGLHALARANNYDEMAEAALLEALFDESNPQYRFSAAFGLSSWTGGYTEAILFAIAQNSKSSDKHAIAGALEFLRMNAGRNQDMARFAKPYLIANIKTELDDTSKTTAIMGAKDAYRMLGGDREVLEALVACALDVNETAGARKSSIGAITAIAPESEAVQRAMAALVEDPNEKVRGTAIKFSSRLKRN